MTMTMGYSDDNDDDGIGNNDDGNDVNDNDKDGDDNDDDDNDDDDNDDGFGRQCRPLGIVSTETFGRLL